MEEAEGSRYWCHMCSQMVNPIREIESVKCPICLSGFVEEMASEPSQENENPLLGIGGADSDRALSLWAPILLGMMSNPQRRRRHRLRRFEFEEDDDVDDDEEAEIDRELSILMRTRRRSTAAILRLLQNGRSGGLSESDNPETNDGQRGRHRDGGDRERDRVILVNPFNQTIIIQDPYDSSGDNSQNRIPLGSLSDYFMGPGLDLLLQHLAENDPNRYGTPPAKKEAVEALANVKTKEALQCSVCLDECEIGTEVKEMPCKHKFHSDCILPWLELHSSCPVCRYQLPSDDESKIESEGPRNISNNSNEENNNENGAHFSVPLPWPFSSLFSSSGSENSASAAQQQGSSSSTDAPPN